MSPDQTPVHDVSEEECFSDGVLCRVQWPRVAAALGAQNLEEMWTLWSAPPSSSTSTPNTTCFCLNLGR